MSDAHVVLQLLVSTDICSYWTLVGVTLLEAEPLVYLAPIQLAAWATYRA